MSAIVRRRPLRLALGAILVGLLALLVLPGRAVAATDDPPVPLPPADGGPYLGPVLDWTDDGAQAYADRLGATPSVYGQSVRYPLNDDDRTYLRQYVDQIAQQGALALLTVEPVKPLRELTRADAEALARELRSLHRRADTRFLVRFAPEMNGSWRAWGQQPAAYRTAFATVADAVHAEVPQAAMLWSPAYGAGYPYGGDIAGGDPYAPYWPGDDAVDWVGLTLYDFGAQGRFGRNDASRPGDLRARLDDRAGYAAGTAPRRSFYATYAQGKALPMALETGALYVPSVEGGDSEAAIKRAWWNQVLDPTLREDLPLLDLVAWLEVSRPEDEADGKVGDWRVTSSSGLARGFLAAARDDDARLGPVTRVLDQRTANEATRQYRDVPDVGESLTWILGAVVLGFVLYLLSGLAGRLAPQWRYPRESATRDDRLDFLRGWTIVAVVVTHIELAGPYSYVTINGIGGITGAEMFVLLSGVVLGMVHPAMVTRMGEWAAAVTSWRRARKQYLTALAVVVIVPLLGLIPFVATDVVTSFTDRGTGAAGQGATGQVYDLYANVGRLLDYPPPWYAVRSLLLLEIGPWVFNIMGLFVVLSLLFPALMWLIRRRLWWLVLAASWGLYLLDSAQHLRPLPSQFQDVFPLLTWQIAFTHGLVIGYYRASIVRALTSRAGKIVVGVLMGLYAAAAVWVWAAHTFDVAIPLVPLADGDPYPWVATELYQRTDLEPGRLLDLAFVLVVAHALLTCCWKPLEKAFGWFYVPLGRVSLYVFIVHVFFVIAVASIPGLDRMSAWQGLVIHTAVLAAIWFMVRHKVGFKVIPT